MGHHKLIQNGLPSCGNSLRKSPPSRRIDADRPSHPAAESPTARKLGLDHSMVGVECAVVAHLMACCCGHMACRCGAAETRARPKHVLCMCVLLYDCFHFIFQQGRKTPKFHFIFEHGRKSLFCSCSESRVVVAEYVASRVILYFSLCALLYFSIGSSPAPGWSAR